MSEEEAEEREGGKEEDWLYCMRRGVIIINRSADVTELVSEFVSMILKRLLFVRLRCKNHRTTEAEDGCHTAGLRLEGCPVIRLDCSSQSERSVCCNEDEKLQE